jgi:hypothetical protein
MLSHQVGFLLVVLAVPARALSGPILDSRRGISMLQTAAEVETDSKRTVSAGAISTEEWEKLQDATYEKEFTIELNVTAAHEGESLGTQLGCRSDHDPLIVLKMRDVGLVKDWNRAHPDKAVQVGDEFVRVGDMKWNRHNDLFMNHLKEQLGGLMKHGPGMTNILELGFRRPRHSAPRPESAEPEAASDIQPNSRLQADAKVVTASEEEEGVTTSEEEELLEGELFFGILTRTSTTSQLAA